MYVSVVLRKVNGMEGKEARVVILTVNEKAGQCYREDLQQVIPEERI